MNRKKVKFITCVMLGCLLVLPTCAFAKGTCDLFNGRASGEIRASGSHAYGSTYSDPWAQEVEVRIYDSISGHSSSDSTSESGDHHDASCYINLQDTAYDLSGYHRVDLGSGTVDDASTWISGN
jgi:hypothetical protein